MEHIRSPQTIQQLEWGLDNVLASVAYMHVCLVTHGSDWSDTDINASGFLERRKILDVHLTASEVSNVTTFIWT